MYISPIPGNSKRARAFDFFLGRKALKIRDFPILRNRPRLGKNLTKMAYFSYSQKQAKQPVRFTFREQKVINNFRRKSYSQKQEKLVPIMGDFPDSSYSQKLKNPSLRLGMDKVLEITDEKS